jgi:TatD DNase family protein
MRFIDTHAHICSKEFDRDLPYVLERAKTAGVTGIVAVGEDLKDAHRNLSLSKIDPVVLPAAGLYPTILDIAQARKLHDFIIRHKKSLIAIGEVGLDYWKVKSEEEREIQREIFRSFIRLSKELDLPLNVHSRSAGRHAIALLTEEGAEKVQIHAFDGRASSAMAAVEAGFYFSIPPSVTRSRQKQKLVRQLSVECLLVETDSPVLGPDPKKRNEPSNILTSIKAIAEIKGLKEEAVAEITYENAKRLYRFS